MTTEVETRACPGVGEFLALPDLEGGNPAPKGHGTCRFCGAVVPYDSERMFHAVHHEVPADRFDCFKCGDTGKISYRTIGDVEPRPFGDGLTIQDMGGSGTRACSCVRDLPPIEGDASWWESETVFNEVFTDTIYPDVAVEVTVRTEVPRDDAGRRVVMRGNRYYPTMIEVEGEPGLMHGEAAREFAAILQRAAGKVEEIDQPCSDLCGHWWPCDCVADAVGKAVAPYVGIRCYTREERWRRLSEPW